MVTITEKQTEILNAIRTHIRDTGQPPTVREIGQAVNLRSSCSVQRQVEALERADLIRRNSYKYRSIELVDDVQAVAEVRPIAGESGNVAIPVIGNVAGGYDIEALQDEDPELILLHPSLLPRIDQIRQQNACDSRKIFDAPLVAFRVEGRSMIDAGIGNGDIVVARTQSSAENGDIVVAVYDDNGATVKKFYRERDRIRLQPANDDFQPIYPESVKIIGKVALSIKRFF